MKIGILGTGVVGNTLGTKLTQQGHQVMMGSRSPNNEKADQWVKAAGTNASQGTFADAARLGEVILNCTSGMASLDALKVSGRENLAGKILIDVANTLDFSKGMPPTLAVSNTDSLAEQIQRAYPDVKVVKALNTMNCYLMVNPKSVPGDHNVFMSGNDAGAKAQVATMLTDWFGWKRDNIIDLGDVATARGAEMLLPIWLRLMGTVQHTNFNFRIAVGPKPQK
ncbi:MAG: NADPH-dependent F420 reductase [bacterium]